MRRRVRQCIACLPATGRDARIFCIWTHAWAGSPTVSYGFNNFSAATCHWSLMCVCVCVRTLICIGEARVCRLWQRDFLPPTPLHVIWNMNLGKIQTENNQFDKCMQSFFTNYNNNNKQKPLSSFLFKSCQRSARQPSCFFLHYPSLSCSTCVEKSIMAANNRSAAFTPALTACIALLSHIRLHSSHSAQFLVASVSGALYWQTIKKNNNNVQQAWAESALTEFLSESKSALSHWIPYRESAFDWESA